MLSYETQLALKQRVVEKAYANFSGAHLPQNSRRHGLNPRSAGLPQDTLPPILPTMPSPKTYGYRTKITPHFEVPQGQGKARQNKQPAATPPDVNIGFAEKGRRRVMDIEECVIATPILNQALPGIRANVKACVLQTRGQDASY